MLRFSADENFNNGIVRGVRRRSPPVDIAAPLQLDGFWRCVTPTS